MLVLWLVRPRELTFGTRLYTFPEYIFDFYSTPS
jgi:hypothetical protein